MGKGALPMSVFSAALGEISGHAVRVSMLRQLEERQDRLPKEAIDELRNSIVDSVKRDFHEDEKAWSDLIAAGYANFEEATRACGSELIWRLHLAALQKSTLDGGDVSLMVTVAR